MPPIPYAALHAFASRALQSTGMSPEHAESSATVLATTDAWGVFTHGTKNLAGYLRRLQAGGLRPTGQPRLVAEGGAWATVDGDSALGMVTSEFAMRVAIAKARQQGIAYVGVRNSCHFGAAGYYAWLAAREGLIGLAMANDIPSVAAPGSRAAVMGSNPIAYAVPAGRHPPLLLDISTATVAGGKVYAAKTRGEPIQPGWIVDGQGLPTTDPSGFPNAGALTPMAGHKGYGIALLIETLSGLLSGAALTWGIRSWSFDEPHLPTHHGAAFLAIDIPAIAPPEEFNRRIEALIDEIHQSPRAEGTDRLLLPGELEWARYQKSMASGIPLPSDVLDQLHQAAALTQTPWPGSAA